jgi:DNA transformation protein and related proteins
MAATGDFKRYVLEQLSALGGITARPMFGAVGLYCDGGFFGLIASDVLYFKVDDATRGDYEARGTSQFRPYRDRPHVSMNYYAVPADVLEDAEECVIWARRSLIIAANPKRRRVRDLLQLK